MGRLQGSLQEKGRKPEWRESPACPLTGSFLAAEVAHAAHPSCPCHCGISQEHRAAFGFYRLKGLAS